MLLPHVGMSWWLCSPAVGQSLCGPASLSLGWRPQKHPAHRAAVRMQEEACCSHHGGWPTASAYQMPARPAELGPMPAPGVLPPLLAADKQAPLIWFLPFGYFLASAQGGPGGARETRRGEGSFLPVVPPVGQGLVVAREAQGWRIPESTGAWWWETFLCLVVGSCFSTGDKVLSPVAGRVCTGRPHSVPAFSYKHC